MVFAGFYIFRPPRATRTGVVIIIALTYTHANYNYKRWPYEQLPKPHWENKYSENINGQWFGNLQYKVSAAMMWCVARSPRIMFVDQVERSARVSCHIAAQIAWHHFEFPNGVSTTVSFKTI